MIDFVTQQLSDSTVVVQVRGNLNESSREYFFDCIADMIGSDNKHIIIECHQLGYLNSSSLASLLTARKRAIKKGCKISLTHLNSNVAEILEMTKLASILSVYPTTEAAIESNRSKFACGEANLEFACS